MIDKTKAGTNMLRKFVMGSALMIAAVLPSAGYALDKQDCDNNAVVWCGAATQSDLARAVSNGDGHNSSANIAAIYSQNSIQTSDISSTVSGYVTKSGNVLVNNKVVATDAQSVGRQFMSGSTAQGSVWIRPTSVSFAADNLEAFVLMKNNQFVWAIIKACGNPVLAKPVVTVTTTPPPPPPPPPPPVAPPPPPPPPPPPIAPPPPPPPPVQIPKTGPEAGLTGVALPAMWFGLARYRRSRRDLRKSLSLTK